MSKILIVDDEPLTCQSLGGFLQGKGYEVVTAFCGEEALAKVQSERPHLMLLDIRLPGVDGLEVLRGARALLEEEVAVIMMTAVRELDLAISSLKMGASDYFTKPVHLDALALAVEKALERRRLLIEDRAHRERLEEKVRERTRGLQGAYGELKRAHRDWEQYQQSYQKTYQRLQLAYGELKRAHLDTVRALAQAIEARDPYRRGHSARVCRLSLKMADHLGLSRREKEILEYGCILHDVGKIGIQGAVLNKPSSLTPEEYAHVKEHPLKGEKILKGVPFFHPILPIVRNHHERSDGRGYPDGLKGGELSPLLKVIILADAFDAMRSDRPYRKAKGLSETLAILRENASTQFDAEVVQLFVDHRIYEEGGSTLRFEVPALAEERGDGGDLNRGL